MRLERFKSTDERLWYLKGKAQSNARIKDLENKLSKAWAKYHSEKHFTDKLSEFIGGLLKELSVEDIHRKIVSFSSTIEQHKKENHVKSEPVEVSIGSIDDEIEERWKQKILAMRDE